MSKIYSRKGDNGRTMTGSGDIIDKDDLLIECIGSVDELSAHLGLLRAYLDDNGLDELIEWIQKRLQGLISMTVQILGETLKDADNIARQNWLVDDDVSRLERSIDEIDKELIPLSDFIIPGKNKVSAQAHVARTVCRRAERRFVALNKNGPLPSETLKFMNRLSDMLFIIARKIEE